MWRTLIVFFVVVLSFTACSSPDRGPTAPAGKAADGGLGGLLDTFDPKPKPEQEQESEPSSESAPESSEADASYEGEPFNIELIFLDSFGREKERWMREVASQWEQFFVGISDHTYVGKGGFLIATYLANPYLPFQIREPGSFTIDDIRIYVLKIEPWELPPDAWGPSHTAGLAHVVWYRPDDERVPIISAIGMHEDFFVRNGLDSELWWKKTFQHELGHAFGIGPSSAWREGIEWLGGDESVFTGANALSEYRQMLSDPSVRGVPLEQISRRVQPHPGHWKGLSPMQWDLFTFYWLSPETDLPNVSRVTLGAFEDIGWEVRYEKGVAVLPPEGPLSNCGGFYICR